MSRTLVFTGTATTQGALIPLDPWSATAEQVALVLADVRSWSVPDGSIPTDDAGILAEYRRILGSPDWVVPYVEDEDASDDDAALYLAWCAIVTPVGSLHSFTRGRFTGARTCERCGLLPQGLEELGSLCTGVRP